MINVIRVLSRVRHFTDTDSEKTFDIAPVVRAACNEINEKLNNPKECDDERIIDVCVYLSLYRLILRGVLTGDITGSVKAGDITISQSPAVRLEWAARMRDEALLAAYPLLKDGDFVFKQVTV